MVRYLSRAAVAAVAALFVFLAIPAPRHALAEDVSSPSSFAICLERSAAAQDVECTITEPIVARTTGTAPINSGLFRAVLPTSRRVNAVIRFERPGCLIWNHTGAAEPTNTSTPVRILELVAPGGLVAGSRVRIESPCIEEWRNGAVGGSSATQVHGISVSGAGVANLSVEASDPDIRVSSTFAGSRPIQGASEHSTLYQSIPSVYAEIPGTEAVVTRPAPVRFGHSVATEADPAAFTANTYPGSGVPGSENNHQMGHYYNKQGTFGAGILDPFEHSWDASWELAYRGTAQTGDKTWVEHNWDFRPPDITVPMTGSSGTFVAGDTLSFSGGGSGRVLSVSGSNPTQTLVYRQNFGRAATGETVTNITRAGGGTLGTLTNTSTVFRPFLFVYDALDNTASFDFQNSPGVANPILSISAGHARTKGRIIPGTVVQGTTALATSAIAAGACDTTNINVTATGALATDSVRWSFAADPGAEAGRLVHSVWTGTNVISFRVCNPSAGSITPAARTVNWIVDRWL